jgi:hypothetical protein
MSDNWQPVHHFEAGGPDPDKPPPKRGEVDSRPPKEKGKDAESPVGLVLSLPTDFISAVWGFGDQVLRLAMAVEENTKAIRDLLKGAAQ